MRLLRNKFAAGFLLLAFTLGAFVFPQPKNAHALFGLSCMPFLCLDPIQDVSGTISSVGDTITGVATPITAGTTTAKLVVDGTPIERAITDVILTPTICDSFANANLLLDTLDSVGGALAGADKAKLTNTFFIQYKVESTRSQLRDCWMPLEIIAQSAKGATNSQAQNLEQNRTLIAQKKQTLTLQLTDYEKQKKQSFQDVFQAIALNFAMEAFKQVTIKGVNELVDKLKINGYLKYADALATQVYSIDYIKQNYSGDKQRELIAASLFKSQALNDIPAVSNAVSIAKQSARKFQTYSKDLDWQNPKYWGKVSGVADERVWPEYHMMVGFSDAQSAIVNGKANAQAEVQNGKGFKSMRNCKDVTSVQQKIDSDLAASNKKVEEAEITLGLLQLAESNPVDIQRAEQALQAVLKEAESVQVKSNGGLAEACEAITQPANFLAETTTKWLDSFIQQQTNFKAENMTLFGTLASKLATTVFKDIINGKGGSVLKELKNSIVPIGMSAAMQGVISASGSGGPVNYDENGGDSGMVTGDNSTIRFSYTNQPNNKLILKVKFEASDDVIPKSLKITISEVADPNKKTTNIIELTSRDFTVSNGLVVGTVELDDVRPSKKSNYSVTLRGIKRSVGTTLLDLVTATVVVPAGTVAGAYIQTSGSGVAKTNVFMPRGPEVKY